MLRRSRVSVSALEKIESLAANQESLANVLLMDKVLDLAPDIFPPHLVGAYLNEDKDLFYRKGDTPNGYFERISSRKNLSTIRLLQKQMHSVAKADATRRTTSVHALRFGATDSVRYDSLDEQYFVFMEKYAEDALQELGIAKNHEITSIIEKYQSSTGKEVIPEFFNLMDSFSGLGIHQNKDKKHKYPVHGLLYGSKVTIPTETSYKIQEAGKLILSRLTDKLAVPADALLFSIDFFLSPDGTISVGRDIHEHQIGMGIQQTLGIDDSSNYYDELAKLLDKRSNGKQINLEYDTGLCATDMILGMELSSLELNLKQRGFLVYNNASETRKNAYEIRLFGGKKGYPTPDVSRLTDDRDSIDSLLMSQQVELSGIGVKVPRSYRTNAHDFIESPGKIIEYASHEIFIHPTVHHCFKPFQVNLLSALSLGSAKEILCSLRLPLGDIPLLITEKVHNYISYGNDMYPHEIRAYYIPDR